MEISQKQNNENTISGVIKYIFTHPLQAILFRWNYKSAFFGAILRASFYFTVYKASKESWIVTLTAVLVELSFRFFSSGISGSIIQSFRKAQPQWLATLIVSISLPIFSHSVEFITHYGQEQWFSHVFAAAENNSRQKAFAISVLFSVLSAVFNLFVMRQGVLLVGKDEDVKTLWGDIKRIPLLVYEFVIFLPIQILDSLGSGKILNGIAYFTAFGVIIGGILGIFRGKWSWAWVTGIGAWVILLIAIILVGTVRYFYRKRKNDELKKNDSEIEKGSITFEELREETY
jgi:hypothetical protein